MKTNFQMTKLSKRLNEYVLAFGPSILSTDGKILICNICRHLISSKKKSDVTQHIITKKHIIAQQKRTEDSNNRIGFIDNANNNEQKTFSSDVCKTFLECNIPLNKLTDPAMIQLLRKYTVHHIPERSTLVKSFIEPAYKEDFNDMVKSIRDHYIWVGIDETTDTMNRHPTVLVIGILDPEQYKPPRLFQLKFLPKVNSETTSRFFSGMYEFNLA